MRGSAGTQIYVVLVVYLRMMASTPQLTVGHGYVCGNGHVQGQGQTQGQGHTTCTTRCATP